MLESQNFVEVNVGTIPLIISVPHGGTLEYEKIPKRENGIVGLDKATNELAKKLISCIMKTFTDKKSTLNKPSYIISKIHRNRIDLNREEIKAYQYNSKLAQEIYRYYHYKIFEIINRNLTIFNKSLLVDIHGFEKNKRPHGFKAVEIVLGTNNLETISDAKISVKNRDKNIRGLIIKKFLDLEIPIAPERLRRKEYVLTGGYTIQKYGASNIKASQAIQIEFSELIRIFDKELRNKALRGLSEVIVDFFSNFF